jgi:predicted flavoprotein YhiN
MLALDLFAELSLDELTQIIDERCEANECNYSLYDILLGLLHPKLIKYIKTTKTKPDGLAQKLKRLEFRVAALPDSKTAQVVRGGYDVGAFDNQNLMSKQHPGLFACGECLDVDGPCGGYNLHWAWASGLLAGQSAVQWAQNH